MTTHAKVALITGAARGIGLATTEILLERGWQVAMVDRDAPALSEAAAGLQGVHPIVADVSIPAEVDAMRDAALSRFGRVDGLVNNAGVALFARAPQTDFEAWREVMATNLDAAFHAARAQLPALLARGGGSLVFVGTFVGHTVGFPGMAAYASSKAGLIGLSQVIAAEYGARGVRSNVLLPGGTDTEMGRQAAPTGDARDFVRSLHALKRMAEPEEIANAALFLASDESSFVTGTAMRVEGGVSITRT